MKTTIMYDSEQLDLDVSENESEFYKIISEKLVEISNITPNADVDIETALGNARYSLGLRSGTLLIREISNNIKLNPSVYNKCYLVCVNSQKNNYKFYQLEDKGNEVLATYGRIGAQKGEMYGQRSYSYPKHMYWIKYREKTSKGYIDKSDVYLSDKESSSSKVESAIPLTATESNASEYLYRKLYAFAKHTYESTCVASVVTEKMVKESKKILNKMYNRKTVKGFNTQLLELLQIAPRKVIKVANLLANDVSDFAKIIAREENLICAMEVLIPKTAKTKKSNNTTHSFDNNEIEVYIATDKQKAQVLSNLDDTLKGRVKNIFRVINKKQQKKFNTYLTNNNITKVKQLWHGSRNENWASIITNGLLLHPNAKITGKMFGDGIYFAPSSRKSWGYTSYRDAYWTKGDSDTAFMGLYATAYGNPLDVYSSYRYTQEIIKSKAANCVHAHAGQYLRNDEIVFYSESAITLNYIVEFQ